MKKYYQTLGLEEGASQEAVKAAYNRLSKELNPANNDNQEFFAEEYNKVQAAYKALYNTSILATEQGARNKKNTAGIGKQKQTTKPSGKPKFKMKPLSLNKKRGGLVILGLSTVILLIYFISIGSQLKSPVYVDSNGITVKAQKWAKIGDEGVIDGVRYTIVDRKTLYTMIKNRDMVDRVCTSFITDMSSLFSKGKTYMDKHLRATQYFNEDISSWDVSNVSDMRMMFYENSAFNQDISNWDVSHVSNMEYMFSANSAFNQPIGNWDVSNVSNMKSMFSTNSAFNQPIGNWDVSHVSNMDYMFINNSAFNQPIGNWDVSHVSDMSSMFSENSIFNQPIGKWDVSHVSIMRSMFSNNSAFNQPIGKWDVSNVSVVGEQLCDNCSPTSGMFEGASNFNQNLSAWNLNKVTETCSVFRRNTPQWTEPKPTFINCKR